MKDIIISIYIIRRKVVLKRISKRGSCKNGVKVLTKYNARLYNASTIAIFVYFLSKAERGTLSLFARLMEVLWII